MHQGSSEDRRLQIMNAALPLFAEKGFRGTTNRDIARAAGIAPGLIYWYFANKEDLFNAILETFIPFDALVLPLEAMREVPPEQFFPHFASGLASIFEESRVFDLGRIVISASLHHPAEGRRLNYIFKRIIDPLAAYLRAQIEAGRLREADTTLMAQMLISSAVLFFIRRRIALDEDLLRYDTSASLHFIFDAFLRAFSP